MAIDITKEKPNLGEIFAQWTVREYEKHVRERRWYWVMGIISAALLIYAILTADYLFALVVVLFGIILFLQDMQEPLSVSFVIAETGVVLGKKFYRYNELKDFWIIYDPPLVKTLYFSTGKLVRHRLGVPLLDNDPRPIRDYLGQYLAENLEEEEEPLTDRIARVFQLH